MNYRHAYHAGNFADVFKHLILCLILERLCTKPAPFCVLDTHAGIGRYDLRSPEAQKTNEAARGIVRLLDAANLPDGFIGYLNAVRGFNPGIYPGSPCLAKSWLRPGDRLVLAELHPDDARALRHEFVGDAAVAVHHMDGYLALKAHLPPPEKRGLVLIDPPYEMPDELARSALAIIQAHKRWPTGIYALWYPIKERAAVWRFHALMEQSGIPKQLVTELTITDERDQAQLNGCGMFMINPPWQLDDQLRTLLPVLHQVLSPAGGGSRVEWLTAA